MDKYDLDLEEKNLVGGIDRLLVNFGMAAIALFQTYFYLIFKPKRWVICCAARKPTVVKDLNLVPASPSFSPS